MKPLPHQIDKHRLALFLAKFEEKSCDECWEWAAATNEHGYGVFWNGERLEKAHRYAYRILFGALAPEADVLHACDNPGCVNPFHLYEGDAASNVADMWAKGRATLVIQRGSAQAGAKLSDAKVASIRARYKSGGVSQRMLAREFGVTQRTIWRVVNGKNWCQKSGVEIVRGCSK